MALERRQILLVLVAILGVLLVISIGGLLALTTTTGESSTQTSIGTSEVGDRLPAPDELVIHIASSGAGSEPIGTGVSEELDARGKRVTVVDDLDGPYDEPLLIVSVEQAVFDRSVTTRTASIEVTFYYSTTGSTAQWRQYRAGESIEQDGPGAIVIGEIQHQDRTRGFTTTARYRSGVYEAVISEIIDNYRGALDGS